MTGKIGLAGGMIIWLAYVAWIVTTTQTPFCSSPAKQTGPSGPVFFCVSWLTKWSVSQIFVTIDSLCEPNNQTYSAH